MDDYFMNEAIKEAKKAYEIGEVPVGCVIVLDGKIISRAHNLREKKNSVLAHAELLAIEKANKKLGSWRLADCIMYVSLEPCPMCSGAIIQSRMKELKFGAYDKRTGACGSVINLFENKFNHIVTVTGGIMEEKCSKLLSDFFKELRP